MNVSQLMSAPALTCSPSQSLAEPARQMWEKDVGFSVVVDPATNKVAGVITDRDICMAAYTRGAALHQIPTHSIMSKNVVTCRDSDSAEKAMEVMRVNQVHRLPVLNAKDLLVGTVTVKDLARAAKKGALKADVVGVLSDIAEPRTGKAKKKAEAGQKGNNVPAQA